MKKSFLCLFNNLKLQISVFKGLKDTKSMEETIEMCSGSLSTEVNY